MRMMAPAGSGKSCGAKRVYDRIFWLERTLLAFERAQIARWKQELEASGEPINHHLAHDDIVLSVNWETSSDRRITQLNCSTTADVRSGYVFRLDVDFDPTVDPVSLFEQSYVGAGGGMKNLRQAYCQKNGLRFTAPLMSFQRPTGRFEEHHLFAAAAHQLALFREQVSERTPDATTAQQAEKAWVLDGLDERIARIDDVHEGYFNVPKSGRDHRATFKGIMTRDIYTKAAHFMLVREMLPRGAFRLITEQEGTLPGILPHIFREEILDERFRWIAMTFDKEVKKPVMQRRVSVFKRDFDAFVAGLRTANPAAEAAMTNGQRLRAFIAARMATAVNSDRFGTAFPFQSDNYRQPFMPMIWLRSPVQTAGESNKVVGFPLMRGPRRREIKAIPFNGTITNPDTRAAMAFHVWSATLQPVSTFFNALRERLSFARRAGGPTSRSGGTYINGATFNPRVLIAVLNIFRVYYNWFEPRQYVAPWLENGGATEGPSGEIAKRIPGTDKVIAMTRRGTRKPIMRTPAMRLGIQPVKHDANGRLVVPSLHRVLYRPWIFAGTPLWDKFENPKADRRRRKRT